MFQLVQEGWTKAAADTLKKYQLSISQEQMENIDAYCYPWTIMSYNQRLELSSPLQEKLVMRYLIPSLKKDLSTLRRAAELNALSSFTQLP